MITRAAAALLDRAVPRRRRAWEAVAREPIVAQERALLGLVARARRTAIGRQHGFDAIRTVADYQRRVPLRDYLETKRLLDRAFAGEHDVTWPGRARYWVKTSGTTAGDKVLPVTREAFAAHRRGGWDALLMAAERVGAGALLGPMLFLGGCTRLAPMGDGCLVGDLSGLVMRRLPPGIRGRYSPGRDVASIPDWETRIEAVADVVARQDLRLISGMPSWMLILFERVARLDHVRRPLGERWPNLGVFVHGGVSFAPYRTVFDERIGRPLERVEVYPASEGFVGLQTERTGGLTLMLDYGIFYEFVPFEDLRSASPRRHTVADVELDRPYAVALTSPAGLWSYLLGDLVRFTARDPLRLEIIGRTRHFVNAFGENVIVEEVERAIVEACRRTGAKVREFTVAPRYAGGAETRGRHEWLVEFADLPPGPLDGFTRLLDETVQQLNTDYRTKRAGDVGMLAPRLVPLPPGTFYRWMGMRGKLGGQNKVPRVTNDRIVAEGLLRTAGMPDEAASPTVLA
ncbi:MAG TPA: GH3 auxin-responsive promoter family protein [Methylomirabilota bacterium]|nr:GH3 auxin-responsive promoter family protein [Methylomirabilota bacterium]